MANCYRCGCIIAPGVAQFRRRIKTGEFERRRYANNRVSTVQTSFGMRVVCKQCAHILDFQRDRKMHLANLQILAGLALLFLIFLLKSFG